VQNGKLIGSKRINTMNDSKIKPKILYVLGSRFPTSKAYGVTCRETVEVLLQKNYEINILAYESSYFDIDFKSTKPLTIYFRSIKISNLLRKYGLRGTHLGHKISWKFSIMFNLYFNEKIIKRISPQIFWTRSPEIAMFLLRKFQNSHVVLETHQRGSDKLYKRMAQFNSRLILCPINKSLFEYIDQFEINGKVLISPMSISKKVIATTPNVETFVRSLERKKTQGLRIGYIGKFAPGGYSKGIEDLITLAEIYLNANSNNTVFIIGGDEQEVSDINFRCRNQGISENNLVVLGHKKHSSALELMKSMDVLVLPSPVTDKYDGTPIKTLEYCASGKIVIAADAKLYREVFDGKFQPFWYEPANAESLFFAIEKAVENSNLQENILQGIEFASLYTWEKRTNNILETIDLH